MLKRQTVAVQDVYVPVKRLQTLDPKKVEALAESILAKGLDAPILVRPDDKRCAIARPSGWRARRSGSDDWLSRHNDD